MAIHDIIALVIITIGLPVFIAGIIHHKNKFYPNDRWF